ncbi:MAG: SPFH domain-containing protein [Planctomycetota bacterium]|jgi:regulator of protease activity HflC (stomatin/prohibitin superfamily)
MHDQEDEHAHRNLEVVEEPLDAAGQSLADALRASFSILKGIMLVLVVLYVFSNVKRIESHEQALQLRLGSLLSDYVAGVDIPRVHEAGLVWSFPYPIDEIVPLPTKKSNDTMIDSNTFQRRRGEEKKALKHIHRSGGRGLHPAFDGALLTADTGLVHLRWKVTYKIDDVASYVREIVGDEVEAAEDLIRIFVETAGIQVASELTAEEIIRTRVDYVQREMLRRVNERLVGINSGVKVTLVEMNEPTAPLQVREAFERTQQAENSKQQRIREAEQERTKILSEAAGAAYEKVLETLDEIDAASGREQRVAQLRAELDRILEEEVEGKAGQLIKDAGAYHSVVVGRMQSDVELYRTLLPEYERNADLLIGRLFEQTRQGIFESPGATKIYRPVGSQFRLKIKRDPEEARREEQRRLQEEEFDVSKINRGPLKPFGPGAW